MKHLIKQHGWFILLAAVLMFQYRTLMASWLMFDDAAHVKFILKNGLSFFYKPAAITGAIPANFTPWMYLNYWLDLKLFGLNIGRYGLHQLLSLLFVLISIYLALGKYLGKMLTLLFMAWFFITPVAHTTIYILCTRHYLEGLGFSMLSIYFYSKYTDQKSTKLLIVSAILYAVACLNKEIYVPLIGFFYLLIFLRYHDTGKIDFKAAFTYVVVAVMYVLYRAFSLSWKNLLSGYGNTPKAEANIGAIVDTVYQYFYILTDHNGLKYVLLTYSTLVVGLAVFLFLKKDYRSMPDFSAYGTDLGLC